MLIVFTRAIILFLFLFLAMRLMGKRQIGQLQPFEFAITMVAAELACIPMAETQIPLSFGLIPIFTLFLMHHLITKVATKSIKFRKILNGKPVIIIDTNGINEEALKTVDMDINDLLESLRVQGYFKVSDIAYAIFETNGNVSVLPKAENQPLTPKDNNMTPEKAEISYSLICEGKLMTENLSLAGTSKEEVERALSHYKLTINQVMLMTLTSGYDLFIQPYIGKYLTDNYVNIIPVIPVNSQKEKIKN
jgi:uncharacterized membrane protein YcaP (DUF421 family)